MKREGRETEEGSGRAEGLRVLIDEFKAADELRGAD